MTNKVMPFKQNQRLPLLVLLVLLSSIAIQMPLYNRGLLFFDEGVIYNYAENILKGQMFFRDIFSYMAPGMFYTLALLYKVFGVSILVSRYAIALVFSATAVVVFIISRHLMDEWVAFLTAIAFTAYRVWAFPIWDYAGYATFSIFFLSIALLTLMKFLDNSRPRFAFLAGFFAALAAMFKQDYGVFTGFGMFLVILLRPYLRSQDVEDPGVEFPRGRATAAYIAGGLVVCLPIFSYFVTHGAFEDMVRQTLLIPLTLETKRETTQLIPLLPLFGKNAFIWKNWNQYAPSVTFMRHMLNVRTFTPPGFLYSKTPVWELLLKLIHYAPYLASSGVVVILAKNFIKGSGTLKHVKAAGVLLFSVFLFLTQHPPFDFAHLMQMYLPVFLLAGFLVDALYHTMHSSKRRLYLVFGVIGVLFGLYLYQSVTAASFIVKYYSVKLKGPRANIYVRPAEQAACSEAIRFITENTSPDEPIYVLPKHPLFYFLAGRRNPTRFQNLWPVKVVENMDKETIDILDREHVEYIVEFSHVFQGHGTYEDYAPVIAEYVKMKFEPAKVIGSLREGMKIIILKRKSGMP